MNIERWSDRLYEDESLTDNLTDDEARALLAWAERSFAQCSSDQEAAAVVERVRDLNRSAGRGERFAELMRNLNSAPPGPLNAMQAPRLAASEGEGENLDEAADDSPSEGSPERA